MRVCNISVTSTGIVISACYVTMALSGKEFQIRSLDSEKATFRFSTIFYSFTAPAGADKYFTAISLLCDVKSSHNCHDNDNFERNFYAGII